MPYIYRVSRPSRRERVLAQQVAAPAPEPTKAELMERATALDIAGRSGMNKADLAKAIEEAEADGD